MGNRAAVTFVSNQQSKPSAWVYLHWNGGPESVYPMVDALKAAGLCNHSPSYTLARFCALACAFVDPALSVGIERFSTPTEAAATADDNGAYVFNISTGTCERTLNGYRTHGGPARKMTADEVAREQLQAAKHKYTLDGLPDELSKLIPSTKVAA